jgi:transaldolase
VSIWLDGIPPAGSPDDRQPGLLEENEVTGVRLNLPAFEEAISTASYRPMITAGVQAGWSAARLYFELLVEMAGQTADRLAPVFEETEGRDGLVALSLPAEFSHDHEALVEEALLLWTALQKQNAILLLPPTEEGIAAFRQLIEAGVSAGVTRLLSVGCYRAVCEAYVEGLERCIETRGEAPAHLASIAEFALGTLERLGQTLTQQEDTPKPLPAAELALSTARVAYAWYQQCVRSERFQALARTGVRAQRLAWRISDAPDGPAADEALLERLMGPATVCELPPDTISSLLGRSLSGAGLLWDLEEARQKLAMYHQFQPDLEQRCALEVENLIKYEVLHTDRAISSIAKQTGSLDRSP